MANLISQMRNAVPQPLSQQQLNESIARTRALMQQLQSIKNPEAVLMNVLQQNPQFNSLTALMRNGTNLEGVAKQMAAANNLNLDQIIKGLNI